MRCRCLSISSQITPEGLRHLELGVDRRLGWPSLLGKTARVYARHGSTLAAFFWKMW